MGEFNFELTTISTFSDRKQLWWNWTMVIKFTKISRLYYFKTSFLKYHYVTTMLPTQPFEIHSRRLICLSVGIYAYMYADFISLIKCFLFLRERVVNVVNYVCNTRIGEKSFLRYYISFLTVPGSYTQKIEIKC